MQIKLKPWSGNERLYFYRQSQQLSGQTGQIGKLRADFDRDGNGFFSSWEDIRGYLSVCSVKSFFHFHHCLTDQIKRYLMMDLLQFE